MGLLNALNVPLSTATVVPVAPVSTADKVSTRVTPVAVAAPTTSQNTSDNRPAPAVVVKSQSADNTGVAANRSEDNAVEFAPSLISESAAVQNALFGRFLPAPTYNTLVGYGFVKYKPSDAGLGSPVAAETAQDAPVSPEYKAYSDTQARGQSKNSGESVIA